jgi:hypothetical protein
VLVGQPVEVRVLSAAPVLACLERSRPPHVMAVLGTAIQALTSGHATKKAWMRAILGTSPRTRKTSGTAGLLLGC